MRRSICSLLMLLTLAALAALATSGCGGKTSAAAPENVAPAPTPASGATPWPAPPDPLQLTRKTGLTPGAWIAQPGGEPLLYEFKGVPGPR